MSDKSQYVFYILHVDILSRYLKNDNIFVPFLCYDDIWQFYRKSPISINNNPSTMDDNRGQIYPIPLDPSTIYRQCNNTIISIWFDQIFCSGVENALFLVLFGKICIKFGIIIKKNMPELHFSKMLFGTNLLRSITIIA